MVETNADREKWNQQFNLNLQPVSVDLSDKRVRQAMYYAVDRRTINDQLFAGRNRILWNPPGFKEYDDLNTYEFNPDKAKELLAAAQADGKFDPAKTIRFMFASDLADGGKIAPIVQAAAPGRRVQGRAERRGHRHVQHAIATTSEKRDKWDLSFGAGGSEGLSPSRSEIYFKCGDEDPIAGRRLLQLRPARPLQKGPDERRPGGAGRDLSRRSRRSLTTSFRSMYLWQLAGVHAVNKRVQGLQVPSFERYATIDAANWSVTARSADRRRP